MIEGNLCNICVMEKCYWHICTDGLAREIIFKDVKDYIFGMNGVPTLSLSYGITVLAFCLMSIMSILSFTELRKTAGLLSRHTRNVCH